MSEKLETAQANLAALAENPYPGRGIVLGLSEAGSMALQAYWVMGRRENSRNRILVEEDDIVKTEAHDPTKVTDPSLTIYNAMRIVKGCHIVSNGAHTDAIVEGIESGQGFEMSLRDQKPEPDAPNYTPRISGIIANQEVQQYVPPHAYGMNYGLSVIRKNSISGETIHKYFHGSLSLNGEGVGQCVHTYLGDDSPLPSFDREPYAVPVGEDVDDTAELLWENLNEDNRVALAVKGIHIATGDIKYRIINAHQEASS